MSSALLCHCGESFERFLGGGIFSGRTIAESGTVAFGSHVQLASRKAWRIVSHCLVDSGMVDLVAAHFLVVDQDFVIKLMAPQDLIRQVRSPYLFGNREQTLAFFVPEKVEFDF